MLSGMAIARFKELCLDARDATRFGQFWAAVLDRTWAPDGDRDGVLTGPTPGHTIWVNGVPGMPIETMDFVPVPEPKAGATPVREPGGDIHWHVLADPEGNEFCVFTDD